MYGPSGLTGPGSGSGPGPIRVATGWPFRRSWTLALNSTPVTSKVGLVSFVMGCLGAGMMSFVALAPGGVEGPSRFALLILLVVFLQIPWSLILILAGMKMMRVESYGLAFVGACLALLPVSLASVVTMPVGLWAIVVLSSREVRDAFQQNAAKR